MTRCPKCGSQMPASCLSDRVDAMRAWALSRIGHCQRKEAEFGAPAQYGYYPAELIERTQERITLQAVLALLDDAAERLQTPDGEKATG